MHEVKVIVVLGDLLGSGAHVAAVVAAPAAPVVVAVAVALGLV